MSGGWLGSAPLQPKRGRPQTKNAGGSKTRPDSDPTAFLTTRFRPAAFRLAGVRGGADAGHCPLYRPANRLIWGVRGPVQPLCSVVRAVVERYLGIRDRQAGQRTRLATGGRLRRSRGSAENFARRSAAHTPGRTALATDRLPTRQSTLYEPSRGRRHRSSGA